MARSASRPFEFASLAQPAKDHRAIPPANGNAGAKYLAARKVGHWRFRSIDDAVDGEPTIAAVRKAGYVSLVAVLCVVSLVGCGSDQPQRPSVANSFPVVVTDLPATVDAVVGQKTEVVLPENVSTGYTWSTVPPLVKPGSAPVVAVGSPPTRLGRPCPERPVSRTRPSSRKRLAPPLWFQAQSA